MEHVKDPVCPLCSNHSPKLLYEVKSELAARHVLGKAGADRVEPLAAHIRKLWNQDACGFYECERCDFSFAYPFIGGDADFYRTAYEGAFYPRWKWEFEKTAGILSNLSPGTRLTLLEVGAGTGMFIRSISPRLFPKADVRCIEYSESGAAAIREYGIRCSTEDIAGIDCRQFGAPFDVVCMFQVLEHMERFDDVFRVLSGLTRAGGHVFIAVPNPAQRKFFDTQDLCQDIPPTHVSRWSSTAVGTLAARHGFEIESFESEPEGWFGKAVRFLFLKLEVIGLQRIPLRLVRRALTVLVLPFLAFVNLPALVKLRARELGTSLWIYLRKV